VEGRDERVELHTPRFGLDPQVLLGKLHLVRLAQALLDVGQFLAQGLDASVLFGCRVCV
jgi:hypothetical protein